MKPANRITCETVTWGVPYSGRPETDPVGGASGERRALRSGSYGSPAKNCRAAYRNFDPPDCRYSTFGLRLALGAPAR